MRKYSIDPPEIRVKQGDLVRLQVSTADVQHGFSVPALKIGEPVNPGKPADIIFRAEKKGVFNVDCGILCGPHHDDMHARILVE
jgi:heme/copper-type cytochrome/quinol oxidase subunit 2